MRSLSRLEVHRAYKHLMNEALKEGEAQVKAAIAELDRKDLFFLLVYTLNRKDVDNDWLYARCNEVQKDPNEYLDLWAREHYKSTIITFGLTIQDILNDPEITIGIFSHTRPISKTFLRQIKSEFETNIKLKEAHPDILWANPRGQAPKWNEDDGIVVKRKGNPKEATVEAWGLVDGMPTGRHFKVRIYDDVVTEKNVTTAEQIKKTVTAWELSLNLGTRDGTFRVVGTRYHSLDAYKTMIDRGTAKPRIYPATNNGMPEGSPVFLTKAQLAKKRRDMGSYIFACQMLQNPVADEAQGFKEEWLQFWQVEGWKAFNRYILIDPAGEKKAESDYTAMVVLGLGADGNIYVIDMVRDRLNLTERGKKLLRLHRKYRPIGVGYEKYGLQADIEYVKLLQEKENYRFNITPLGGPMPKHDRIRRLVPDFEQGRVFLPYRTMYVDYQKKIHDLTMEFIKDEYVLFPVAEHEDMLDGMARIKDPDLGAVYPDPGQVRRTYQAVTDYDALNGVPQPNGQQAVSGMDYNPI